LENNKELTFAVGENRNPFYQVSDVKKPLVSEKAGLKGVDLTESYLYDVLTKAGEEIVIIR